MGSDTGNGCKVDVAIENYDLDTVDPRYERINTGLLARWTGEDSEPEGYRPLTEWFNKRLLKCVYDKNGRDAFGTRLDSDYEVLENDDELLRAEVIADLETDGIDAEAVVSDMVSWGTMRNHLLECLDGEKEAHTAETRWEHDSIEMARDFAEQKVSQAITSLAKKEQLHGLDHSSIEIQALLSCEECPTRVPLEVVLDRGYVCEQHDEQTTQAHEL
jgi:rubrerythrin